MADYNVPPNLKAALQSPAGREALDGMFQERLRALTTTLARATTADELFRVQGAIREVEALMKSLAK